MSKMVEAAGIIIFARTNPLSFLLLQHSDRWDLPKGHAEPGESVRETALREATEETGIASSEIQIEADFEFTHEYLVTHSKRGNYNKRVTYFLGYVDRQPEIVLTEHRAYRWFDWPTGPIQAQTIDPLLAAVQTHFDQKQSQPDLTQRPRHERPDPQSL